MCVCVCVCVCVLACVRACMCVCVCACMCVTYVTSKTIFPTTRNINFISSNMCIFLYSYYVLKSRNLLLLIIGDGIGQDKGRHKTEISNI